MRLLHKKEEWVTILEIVHNSDFYPSFFYSNLSRKENSTPACVDYKFDDCFAEQLQARKIVNTVHKDTIDLHYNLGV